MSSLTSCKTISDLGNKEKIGNYLEQKHCIKFFCYYQIMLDFLTLFKEATLCLEVVPISCKVQYFNLFYNFKAFLEPLMQL